MYPELLTSTLQAASLLILAFAAFGLYVDRMRQDRRTTMQAAGSFIQRWNSPEFVRLSSFLFDTAALERLRDVENPYEQLGREEFNYLIVMLNFFEEMALSVEFRLADEHLLRKYFAQSAVEVFKSLEPVIYSLRRERRNKAIFVSFERLVGRWSFAPDA